MLPSQREGARQGAVRDQLERAQLVTRLVGRDILATAATWPSPIMAPGRRAPLGVDRGRLLLHQQRALEAAFAQSFGTQVHARHTRPTAGLRLAPIASLATATADAAPHPDPAAEFGPPHPTSPDRRADPTGAASFSSHVAATATADSAPPAAGAAAAGPKRGGGRGIRRQSRCSTESLHLREGVRLPSADDACGGESSYRGSQCSPEVSKSSPHSVVEPCRGALRPSLLHGVNSGASRPVVVSVPEPPTSPKAVGATTSHTRAAHAPAVSGIFELHDHITVVSDVSDDELGRSEDADAAALQRAACVIDVSALDPHVTGFRADAGSTAMGATGGAASPLSPLDLASTHALARLPSVDGAAPRLDAGPELHVIRVTCGARRGDATLQIPHHMAAPFSLPQNTTNPPSRAPPAHRVVWVEMPAAEVAPYMLQTHRASATRAAPAHPSRSAPLQQAVSFLVVAVGASISGDEDAACIEHAPLWGQPGTSSGPRRVEELLSAIASAFRHMQDADAVRSRTAVAAEVMDARGLTTHLAVYSFTTQNAGGVGRQAHPSSSCTRLNVGGSPSSCDKSVMTALPPAAPTGVSSSVMLAPSLSQSLTASGTTGGATLGGFLVNSMAMSVSSMRVAPSMRRVPGGMRPAETPYRSLLRVAVPLSPSAVDLRRPELLWPLVADMALQLDETVALLLRGHGRLGAFVAERVNASFGIARVLPQGAATSAAGAAAASVASFFRNQSSPWVVARAAAAVAGPHFYSATVAVRVGSACDGNMALLCTLLQRAVSHLYFRRPTTTDGASGNGGGSAGASSGSGGVLSGASAGLLSGGDAASLSGKTHRVGSQRRLIPAAARLARMVAAERGGASSLILTRIVLQGDAATAGHAVEAVATLRRDASLAAVDAVLEPVGPSEGGVLGPGFATLMPQSPVGVARGGGLTAGEARSAWRRRVGSLLKEHPLCPCDVWVPIDVTWCSTAAAAGLVSLVERWGGAHSSPGAIGADGVMLVRMDRLDAGARESRGARAAMRIQATWRGYRARAVLAPRAVAAADFTAAHLRERVAALEELASLRAAISADFYAGAARAWVSAELCARRELRLGAARAHAALIDDLIACVVAMEATLRREHFAAAWAELALLGSLGLRHRALHRARLGLDADAAMLRCERAEYVARCAVGAAAFSAYLQMQALSSQSRVTALVTSILTPQ